MPPQELLDCTLQRHLDFIVEFQNLYMAYCEHRKAKDIFEPNPAISMALHAIKVVFVPFNIIVRVTHNVPLTLFHPLSCNVTQFVAIFLDVSMVPFRVPKIRGRRENCSE